MERQGHALFGGERTHCVATAAWLCLVLGIAGCGDDRPGKQTAIDVTTRQGDTFTIFAPHSKFWQGSVQSRRDPANPSFVITTRELGPTIQREGIFFNPPQIIVGDPIPWHPWGEMAQVNSLQAASCSKGCPGGVVRLFSADVEWWDQRRTKEVLVDFNPGTFNQLKSGLFGQVRRGNIQFRMADIDRIKVLREVPPPDWLRPSRSKYVSLNFRMRPSTRLKSSYRLSSETLALAVIGAGYRIATDWSNVRSVDVLGASRAIFENPSGFASPPLQILNARITYLDRESEEARIVDEENISPDHVLQFRLRDVEQITVNDRPDGN